MTIKKTDVDLSAQLNSTTKMLLEAAHMKPMEARPQARKDAATPVVAGDSGKPDDSSH